MNTSMLIRDQIVHTNLVVILDEVRMINHLPSPVESSHFLEVSTTSPKVHYSRRFYKIPKLERPGLLAIYIIWQITYVFRNKFVETPLLAP